MKYMTPIVLAVVAAAFAGGLIVGFAVNTEQVQTEETYTCPMHPQIQRPGPGACPICGMALTQLEIDDAGPQRVAMSEAAAKLAEIVTAPVERKVVTAEVRMVGKVAYDQTRVKTISAWIPSGRLERQYIDYAGVPVKKGEHLVLVYSPELLTAQQALLQAKKAVEQAVGDPSRFLPQSDKRGLESAREKLRLWGLTAAQIEEIEKRGTPDDHVTIHSPTSGIVIHKWLDEGDYVQTGTPLYRIADLEHLWVVLDAYQSDLPWIRYGQRVEIDTDANPGEPVVGTISFVDPMLDELTRTVKVRVNVENKDGSLKPGMFVRGIVEAHVAGGGKVMDPSLAGKWICPMHPEVVEDEAHAHHGCPKCGMKLLTAEELGFVQVGEGTDKPLVVPVTAVLVTGKRGVAYVQVPGTEEPTYEMREVVLGPRTREHYIVFAGLKEGEQVVAHGNFKIDSAMQIAGKPSMMSMDDGPAPMHGADTAGFRAALAPLSDAYFAAWTALAADDDAAAREAFTAVGKAAADIATAVPRKATDTWQPMASGIEAAARAARAGTSIDDTRRAFRKLARTMLDVERMFGHQGDEPRVEVFCSMAFDNEGAAWLQRSDEVRNPFYGASMLQCGQHRRRFAGLGDPVNQPSKGR